MTRASMTWLFAIALVLAALGQGAEAQGPGCRGGCGPATVDGPRIPLDEAQQAAIAEALQDEYRGEAIYARVLHDHGDIRPFSNVVHAEQRHAAFLEELLRARTLPVPANGWVPSEAPAYASRQEACAAAIEFEMKNVALYDRLLAAGTLPDDVRQAFEHNRMASLEHHKPAFERCATGGGRGQGTSASGARGRGRGHGCGGQGGGGRCRRGADSD